LTGGGGGGGAGGGCTAMTLTVAKPRARTRPRVAMTRSLSFVSALGRFVNRRVSVRGPFVNVTDRYACTTLPLRVNASLIDTCRVARTRIFRTAP
jgi:hypothetical protein